MCIATISSPAAYFATTIKARSNAGSCAVISGDVDGIGYQYQATTSGPNCDTTSEQKTNDAAVTTALSFM